MHEHNIKPPEVSSTDGATVTYVQTNVYPHTHTHTCNHSLEHCKVCDIVYCNICGKEWTSGFGNWKISYPGYFINI